MATFSHDYGINICVRRQSSWILHGCVVGFLSYTQEKRYTMFLRSDAMATMYFAACFVQLLFEGGVYVFGKPGDINDGWISTYECNHDSC